MFAFFIREFILVKKIEFYLLKLMLESIWMLSFTKYVFNPIISCICKQTFKLFDCKQFPCYFAQFVGCVYFKCARKAFFYMYRHGTT